MEEWTDALDKWIAATGFCACGSPERIATLMHAYLRAMSADDADRDSSGTLRRATHVWERPEWTSTGHEDDDVFLMIAYIADVVGWTEHGGSVYGAWITEKGREAMGWLLEMN